MGISWMRSKLNRGGALRFLRNPAGAILNRARDGLRFAWGKIQLRRAQVLLLLGCVLLGVGGSWGMASALKNAARACPAFRVGSVRVVHRPSWLPRQVAEEIRASYSRTAVTTIFDPDALSKVRRAFEINPWVAMVLRVTRRFPNRIECELRIRRPVAVVMGSKYYLMDAQGVRLPPIYDSWPIEGVSLPLVVGVPSQPPSPGRSWSGPEVVAATAIIADLHRYGLLARGVIAEIDVSNLGFKEDARESEIVLVTRAGTEVRWGGSGLSNRPGELSGEERARLLWYILSTEDSDRLQMVDIRFRAPVKVERSNLLKANFPTMKYKDARYG